MIYIKVIYIKIFMKCIYEMFIIFDTIYIINKSYTKLSTFLTLHILNAPLLIYNSLVYISKMFNILIYNFNTK